MKENDTTDDMTTLVLSKATIDTTYHLLKPHLGDPVMEQHILGPMTALIDAASEVPAHDKGATVSLPDADWAMLWGFAIHCEGNNSVSREDAQRVVGAFDDGFPEHLTEKVKRTRELHEQLKRGEL